MSKYKQQVTEMIEMHKDLFASFRELHDAYERDPKKMQKQFNEEGQKVLEIVRRYENMLCSRSESGKYGKFSANLSDKFREALRFHFPKIDYIGLE